MSRSVSAPSSVTKTSPCWWGLIVPGSTFRYGSSFCRETVRWRAFRMFPIDAAVIPLPSEETTPPVTKTYFDIEDPPGGFSNVTGDGGRPNVDDEIRVQDERLLGSRAPPGCDTRGLEPSCGSSS